MSRFPRSLGRVVGSMSACTVLALSLAEISVEHPFPIKSIDTVGVSKCELLESTIISILIHRSSINGVQIKPLPCVAIKLISSGVAFLAECYKITLVFTVFIINYNHNLSALMSSNASSIVFAQMAHKVFKFYAKLVH